jgi:hypothetical protein
MEALHCSDDVLRMDDGLDIQPSRHAPFCRCRHHQGEVRARRNVQARAVADATGELTNLSMKLLFCSALLCCSAKAAWVQHPAVRFSGGATVPRAAVAATATEAEPSAVKEEKYEFEAEVSKVMDIIINSLYSDKVRPP